MLLSDTPCSVYGQYANGGWLTAPPNTQPLSLTPSSFNPDSSVAFRNDAFSDLYKLCQE